MALVSGCHIPSQPPTAAGDATEASTVGAPASGDPRDFPPPKTRRPVTTSASDLRFEVEPTQLELGETPRMAIVRGESLPERPRLDVDIILTKPDGTERKLQVHIEDYEAPIFSQGGTSMHRESFSHVALSFEAVDLTFDGLGRYRLDAVDQRGRAVANTVEIVVARDRRFERLIADEVAGIPLLRAKMERSYGPMARGYEAEYVIPKDPNNGRMVVTVWELDDPSETAELMRRVRGELRNRPQTQPMLPGVMQQGGPTIHFITWTSGRFAIKLYATSYDASRVKTALEAYVARYPIGA